MADRTVELRMAWAWTCEDCGRDQFAAADPVAAATMTDEEIEECEAEGVDPHAVFDAPERVRCGHCGAEFGTEVG